MVRADAGQNIIWETMNGLGLHIVLVIDFLLGQLIVVG